MGELDLRLVFAALLITTGRLGDRYGRRSLLVVGILVFGVGSVLAAVAAGAPTLLAARFVQGVGGAAILPATLSTVNALFTGRERGIAFAIWGSTIGGMAAVGPVVGGWLTTDYSWRWAFLINIPIVIIVLVGACCGCQTARTTTPPAAPTCSASSSRSSVSVPSSSA